MANAKLEEAKKNNPQVWKTINDRWHASAEKATDGRPDYAWALRQAHLEFAAELGVDFGEDV